MGGLGAQEGQEGFTQPLCQLRLITVIPEKPVTANYLHTHESEDQPASLGSDSHLLSPDQGLLPGR